MKRIPYTALYFCKSIAWIGILLKLCSRAVGCRPLFHTVHKFAAGLKKLCQLSNWYRVDWRLETYT